MSRLYDLFCAHPQVSTDSRRIEPGSLFFALRGASFDGNRFAADALARGAAFAVVDDPGTAAMDSRMIRVPDVLAALQELAREHRRALGIPVMALTGSNGKTTTKELVSRVLAERFRVYATCGNLNNHIGVPLTLLSMTPDTEFGVVEMGASAQGEIALLCKIAEPDYGLITNIGRAHLDGFGGPEGVRRGKGELFDYLAAHGGRAFVPEDDPMLVAMAAERPSLAATCYSRTLADGMEHRLEGAYNRANIAAAVAVGHYFGIGDENVRHAVASYVPDNHRSQRIETGRNTVIADCYNANPSSMQAAIENFNTEPLGQRREKVLILGDMLELGDWSLAEHVRIAELALSISGARLLLVGEAFAAACRRHACNAPEKSIPDRNARNLQEGENFSQEGTSGTVPSLSVLTAGQSCPNIGFAASPATGYPGYAPRTEKPATGNSAAPASSPDNVSGPSGFPGPAGCPLPGGGADSHLQVQATGQTSFAGFDHAPVFGLFSRVVAIDQQPGKACDGMERRADLGPESAPGFTSAPSTGDAAGSIAPDACTRIRLFPSREALEAYLAAQPIENALVLVKGSHSIGLEKTLALL